MQKGFTPILILVLAAGFLIIAGGAYYFWVQKKTESDVFQPKIIQQQVTALPSTTPSAKNSSSLASEASLNPNSQIYISQKLGISFQYAKVIGTEKLIVKEEGSKISVSSINFINSGQSVEIFTKDPKDTLVETIKKKFLTDKYPEKDCLAQETPNPVSAQPLPGSYVIVEIKAPVSPDDNLETMIPKWEKCPPNYTTTNGIAYFLMDKNHPDKFAFFSIGQDAIDSGTPGVAWQNTIKFL